MRCSGWRWWWGRWEAGGCRWWLADLLRFGLGPRRYAGPASDLVRSEAPAPPPKSEKVRAVGEVAPQAFPEPVPADVPAARVVRKAAKASGGETAGYAGSGKKGPGEGGSG